MFVTMSHYLVHDEILSIYLFLSNQTRVLIKLFPYQLAKVFKRESPKIRGLPGTKNFSQLLIKRQHTCEQFQDYSRKA